MKKISMIQTFGSVKMLLACR